MGVTRWSTVWPGTVLVWVTLLEYGGACTSTLLWVGGLPCIAAVLESLDCGELLVHDTVPAGVSEVMVLSEHSVSPEAAPVAILV